MPKRTPPTAATVGAKSKAVGASDALNSRFKLNRHQIKLTNQRICKCSVHVVAFLSNATSAGGPEGKIKKPHPIGWKEDLLIKIN